MAVIIETSDQCNIEMFMECLFKKRYTALLISGEADEQTLKNAFEIIHAQYVDDSGLYQSAEYDKYAYIDMLQKRINTVENFILLQKEFIYQFDVPCIAAFDIIKRYGHRLSYDVNKPDTVSFIKKLDSIQVRENKYRNECEKKKKELFELQGKKQRNELTTLQTRKEFISMLTKLQQQKFVIDRKITTVEDLSIMIRDCREQAQEQKAKQQFKNRY